MIYAFREYELDTQRYELRRAGTLQHIEPKVFDLLTLLMQHHGHIVTKETLLERLWANQSVSEAALTYCIRAARQAIGDNGRTQQVIKTVHGRGYRFIAVVEQWGEPEVASEAPPALPASPQSLGGDLPTASSLGERRQLTVLFCRIVPTTPLAAHLDPEDVHEAIHAAQQMCVRTMEAVDGYITQYLGDGVLVCFGYPLAHEDDAQRAVHTALQCMEMLAQQHVTLTPQHTLSFTVCAGIHTGFVVSGGRPAHRLALGALPNVVTQLQGLADPGMVLVSATTHQLIARSYVCRALGSYILEEPSRPLEVYQVLRAGSEVGEFDPAMLAPITPLIGREQEVGYILERWQQAQEGNGQVVLVSGEAGIGKSRLVQVLRERFSQDACTLYDYRGTSSSQHSAMFPVIEHWQRRLQWERDDSPEDRLHTLESALRQHPVALHEVLPLFATLLSLPLPPPYAPLTLSPPQYKHKMREALLLGLLQEAEHQPVCLIVEDLHWIDPSTLEWLTLLVDQAPMTRLLVILTFRPDFRPTWVGRSHLSHITLNRLSATQIDTMIRHITRGKPLPGEIVGQLQRKTDGVPLFVEEMTRMVVLSGMVKEKDSFYELSDASQGLAIPPTLQDSLMARLDRLGPAKQVAQVGATLGREFSYDLLQAVMALPEATLQQELAHLVDAGLLYQRGLPPRAQYLFKHVLLQEAAYQSLLRSTKQLYHRKAAQALESHFPEICTSRPELLASHYTTARLHAQALPYWQQASQHAMGRSAHLEALAHVRQGLALLPTLPDTPERLQYELTLLMTLGVALTATKGYAAPEVERAYLRARELCLQGGDVPQLFTVLRGLWLCYLVRGALLTACDLAEKLWQLAQSWPEPALLIEAHRVLGASLFFRGELARARHHLEQGLALYDTQQHAALTSQYGQDSGAVCLAYMAWALWLGGYPEQALATIAEAQALTQSVAHPFSQGLVLIFATMLQQCLANQPAVQASAETSTRLGGEHQFPIFVAMGTTFQGWALAVRGTLPEGLNRLLHGLAMYRDTGAELARTYMLGLLAEVYWRHGKNEQGLRALEQAQALVEKNGEHFWQAELYRLQAELLWQRGSVEEMDVEELLQRALEVARHQQALALEVRAATSLGRLWQHQGKEPQARQLLEHVTQKCTEGFSTADVVAATALLTSLG